MKKSVPTNPAVKNAFARHRAGLTLIEVMVSIAMLMLLIGLVFPSLLMNQKVNRDSRAEQVMTAYAKASMEIAKQGLLTRTTSPTDPYPYLRDVTTANTLLASLTYPSKPAGMTCTAPTTSDVQTYSLRSVTLGSRATITVTCTLPGKTGVPFIEQVVRPV